MKKYGVYQRTIWFGEDDELLRVYDTREEAENFAHGMVIDTGKYVMEIDVPDEK